MKKIDFKTIILYSMVFYILNKNLIDFITHDYSKIAYYLIVAISACLGIIKLLKRNYGIAMISLFAAYSFYIVLNGLLLSNTPQLLLGLKEYITFPLVFFSFVYLIDDKLNTNTLFKSIAIWGAFSGVISVFEYVSGGSLLPEYFDKMYIFADGTLAYRGSAFIGSPMLLALALGMASIFSLYFCYKEKKKLYFMTFIIALAGIICTSSRGPLIACVAGIVAMYFLLFLQGKLSKRFVYIAIGLMCTAFCVLLAFVLIPGLKTGIDQIDFLIYRITSSFDFTGEWGNAERIVRWTYYINQFLERPIFGYGLSTTSAQILTNPLVTAHGITTESGVLARLVETGLVGTGLYYAFLYYVLSKGIIPLLTIKRVREKQETVNAMIGILIMLFIENIILQITLSLHMTFLLWFILAMGIGMLSKEEKCFKASFTNQSYKKKSFTRKILRNHSLKKNKDMIEKNKDCKIAVILHLFYEDSWGEIKEYLSNLNAYHYDLFITIPQGFVGEDCIQSIKEFKQDVHIEHCENKGFDLGPFFQVLNSIDLDHYDIVFKLQSKSTKRSWIYIYNQFFLRRDWFVNLFEGVLGANTVHLTIDQLLNNDQIGLVAAKNLIVHDPVHKEEMIMKLSQKYNCRINKNYEFVAGTCFALKASALKDIQSLKIHVDQFENTSTSRGLSFAHFIERYICCSIANQGYKFYGCDVLKLKRCLLYPVRSFFYHHSSERLFDEPIHFDAEWFFWQLDNRIIHWKYKTVEIGKLKYTFNERDYDFTKCPPYQYLQGDVEGYIKYCEYHKNNNLPVMSIERFEALKQSIEVNGYDERHMIVVNDRLAIMDGQHRACCLCKQNGKDYKVKVLMIKYLDIKSIIKSILPKKLRYLYFDIKNRK